MISISELLRQQKQKTVAFVGYPERCRLIEREFVGTTEKEFKLVGTAPHSNIAKISEVKAEIILFDLIELYQGRGPEIIDKIVRYYGGFWAHVFNHGLAEKVVILFCFTPKGEEKAKGYQYPWALLIHKEERRPIIKVILDKSWFLPSIGSDGKDRERVPLDSVWDYLNYQANAPSTGAPSLEKLPSSVRDYALVLRQTEHIKKEPQTTPLL